MRVYNYTDHQVTVDGHIVLESSFLLPDDYQGELKIGGTSVSWADDPYHYVMFTESAGNVDIVHPTVPQPPYVPMMILLLAAFSLTLFVKIIQKLKTS